MMQKLVIEAPAESQEAIIESIAKRMADIDDDVVIYR